MNKEDRSPRLLNLRDESKFPDTGLREKLIISNKLSLFSLHNSLSVVGDYDVCQNDAVEHENKSKWTD